MSGSADGRLLEASLSDEDDTDDEDSKDEDEDGGASNMGYTLVELILGTEIGLEFSGPILCFTVMSKVLGSSGFVMIGGGSSDHEDGITFPAPTLDGTKKGTHAVTGPLGTGPSSVGPRFGGPFNSGVEDEEDEEDEEEK